MNNEHVLWGDFIIFRSAYKKKKLKFPARMDFGKCVKENETSHFKENHRLT